MLATVWSLACGSSGTQTVTGPSTSKCPVTAAADPTAFAASGGSGLVSVNTNRECQWNAAASGNWIQLGSQAVGQGEGRVAFSVLPNGDPAERRGMITVGDQQISIAQAAAPCTFDVSPRSGSVTPTGERRTITVTASSAQCQWTARSESEWLSIVEGDRGTGSGRVVYEARSSTGPSRTGTLVVAGHTVTVTQGIGCGSSISPASQNVGASGGSGAITVNTAAGCPWSAQSEAPWISITSGQSGSGPGTVGFSVGAWDGATRSGTLRVDGHVFTVTQTAGCSYSIDRTSQTFGAGAGTGSINLSAGAGCAWTAAASEPWVRITAGASGSGNGTVQFAIDANSGAERTATITAGGRAFTVQQSGGCSYTINPSNQPFPAGGGNGSFTVAAGSGCAWTAKASQPWVVITSGANGSGNGTVQFRIDANSGADRTATITAGGRTFTVQQAGGCSFTINPTSQPFGASGGAGSFTVTAGSSCDWSATASQSWVRVTSGSTGTGNGTVQFTVEANSGADRNASIAAGGRTFSVNQSAGCAYSLSATSASFGADGGTGGVNVSAAGSCSWTASTAESWVRVTSGASGSGDGTVQFAVDANASGAPRSATLNIAGQSFTIQQAAACSYSISPTTLLLDAAGGAGSFALSADASCSWTAVSSAGWLQIAGGASGSGAGTVSFNAAANTGPARNATITAGGQTFTASQGSGCTVTIAPAAQNFDVTGGTGAITVTTDAGCAWSAAVTAGGDWISISGGASGTGAGTVQFTVTANAGPARSGTIVVSGQALTVTQGGV